MPNLTVHRHLSATLLVFLLYLLALPAHGGQTLEKIKQRDSIRCGVTTGLSGFSARDASGRWQGLDVDTCRALAAAVLHDAEKVEFIALDSTQRFEALAKNSIDVLARNTTWNLSRDASMDAWFTAINYYDGQSFLVPRRLEINALRELDGTTICTQADTTNAENVHAWAQKEHLDIQVIARQSFEDAWQTFFAGKCQAFTADASALASLRAHQAPDPEQYIVLPERISKEPLAPMVRRTDQEWFTIVKWVVYALINAEEIGITQANVHDLLKGGANQEQSRFLGISANLGSHLGLDRQWAYRIVQAVGNYGEVFERNVGARSALKIDRSLNNLWTLGGLLYAPPMR